MEIGGYTQRVLQRIQKIEPENATKIFGYLLLQHSLEEIIEYAMGNEEHINSLIAEAKHFLMSSPKFKFSDDLHSYVSYNHTIPCRFSSPPSFRVPSPIHLVANQQPLSQKVDHFPHDVWSMEEQLHSRNPMDCGLPGSLYFPDGGLSLRSQSQFSCRYFYKDYCKHGQSCKFSHGLENSESSNEMFGTGLNEFTVEDHMFSSGSLEKLEMEITMLLKARRGLPIPLASLPMLYQDMYGKALQAEGYLSESQRHGKVGFSLTKLLARLRNIRLIDRHHGQHSLVLAEDAPKYIEFWSERNEPGTSSSHQIYLTFPAESTFTDVDVQNYFNQFGPVHDVRIPRQERRMFGFVSFYCTQTVKQILAMGHPHIISGSRVLVKPYKEKSRLVERKYAENSDPQIYLSCISDNGLGTRERGCEPSQFHIKQQIEGCKLALDLKRRQHLELQRSTRPQSAQPYLDNGLAESEKLEDQFCTLCIASRKSTDDAKTWKSGSNYNDQDRLQIQLPESPFAFPRFGSNNLYTVV